jgi:hypothetical protein
MRDEREPAHPPRPEKATLQRREYNFVRHNGSKNTPEMPSTSATAELTTDSTVFATSSASVRHLSHGPKGPPSDGVSRAGS